MPDSIRLVKAKDTTSVEKIGRERTSALCYILDNLTSSNIHETLDDLLRQFRSNHKTGSLTIHFQTGGIAGGEYTETKKS